jgi:hypothetical protein
MRSCSLLTVLTLLTISGAGCAYDDRDAEGGNGIPGATAGSDEGGDGDGDGAGDGDGDGDGGDGDGESVLLDVGASGDGDGDEQDMCNPVTPDGSGVGDCEEEAPPDSFEPEIQWTWSGPNNDIHSITTPLVINMTDDNDDGVIDLCDTPDVIVLAGPSPASDIGHIYVLDGATGQLHFQIERDMVVDLNPAVGDIDGDGLPEIVAGASLGIFGQNIAAWEHDGTPKWEGDGTGSYGDTVALADLDNDGDVEILSGGVVYDHEGHKLFLAPGSSTWNANTAADLDGDGDLEVVTGKGASHHDGTEYYFNEELTANGYPQVANLDDDPEPEILVTTWKGMWILEHDGTTKLGPLTPTGDPPTGTNWERPAVIHDFDGDGVTEFATSSAENYATYERDGTLIWTAPVQELSGIASGTAFDFLGDGKAEAMYADEVNMYIFGSEGEVLLEIPRTSTTLTEYPIVADIDNDGSAEIVVTSNGHGGNVPTVQVIRDKEDRWIQARRIWNQHTYHVTNVDELGRIPQYEAPNWEIFNTFRTNSQIEEGGDCVPPAG